jgi:hypothetical protein
MTTLEERKLQKRVLSNDGNIKSFSQIGISTKTVIAITNIKIDLDKLFNLVPITDYEPIKKRRGRRKRMTIEAAPQVLPYGSIVLVQRRRDSRGVSVKNKTKRSNTFFLHSVTVVLALNNNKFINAKISQNGKFQITGCKSDAHYIETLQILIKTFNDIKKWTGETVYTVESDTIEVIFNTVMQNMDFNIGFPISRDKLDRFINAKTDFTGVYEGSISTGVNIKIPSLYQNDIQLLKLRIQANDHTKMEQQIVPYTSYYSLLEDKEKKKEKKKEKYHTFLVFASGSIIMSSRGPDMERVFYELIQILLQNRSEFEETLVASSKKLEIIDPDEEESLEDSEEDIFDE